MRRLRNKPPKAFCAMEVCFYYVGALSKLNWAMNHPQLIHVHLIIPRCARGGGRVVRYCPTVPTLSLSLFLSLYSTLSLLGPVKRLICIKYHTKQQLKQLIAMSCNKSNLI